MMKSPSLGILVIIYDDSFYTLLYIGHHLSL